MTRKNSYLSAAAAAPCTTLACLLCIFVCMGLNSEGQDVSWSTAQWWGYFPDNVIWEGKPWALITSTFVHVEIWHLLFNVYWLWLLGSCFEITLGWMRWLLFFLTAAWVSSSAQLLLGGSTGIGMSGVVYALFGFGWVARKKLPRFAAILNEQTAMVFLIWLILCVALTNFGVMQVGNWAHIFGLAFGASVAALWAVPRLRVATAAGLVVLLAASFVPLAWCPTSVDWTGLQATRAEERKDYDGAIRWYTKSLALGQDPEWVWKNLAGIYAGQGKKAEYAKAVSELRSVDKKGADETEADYGPSNQK